MRLFLSLPVPSTAVEPSVLTRLKNRFPDARWSPSDQWHITLKFLGETPIDKVESIARVARGVAAAARSMTIVRGPWGVFPGNPGVLWLGAQSEGETLSGLARALDSALAPWGFPVEQRPFQAHITLARFPRSFLSLPSDLPSLEESRFEAGALDLMESRPGSNGRVHRRLAKMVLGVGTIGAGGAA